MAENQDRIVYPDEVEAVKEAAAKAQDAGSGDNNSVEQSADAAATPQVAMRNMISVPDNCPPGYQLINGVCREVFD